MRRRLTMQVSVTPYADTQTTLISIEMIESHPVQGKLMNSDIIDRAELRFNGAIPQPWGTSPVRYARALSNSLRDPLASFIDFYQSSTFSPNVAALLDIIYRALLSSTVDPYDAPKTGVYKIWRFSFRYRTREDALRVQFLESMNLRIYGTFEQIRIDILAGRNVPEGSDNDKTVLNNNEGPE